MKDTTPTVARAGWGIEWAWLREICHTLCTETSEFVPEGNPTCRLETEMGDLSIYHGR